ncbi:MAG TPA: hypothetical protein VKX16_16705 [Chloroflexota bacterium]|nr:hypothetical protein [Chloroflexota bacterium]
MRARRLIPGRLLLVPIVLAGAAFSPLAVPRGAQAHYGPCYDDPTVWLSNKAKIHLISVVQGNLNQVSQVTFTLHIPVGVTYTQIQYTGGHHPPEVVNVVSDQSSGYLTNEYAATKKGQVYSLTLSVHDIEHGRGSQWAQNTGTTNENVQVFVQ